MTFYIMCRPYARREERNNIKRNPPKNWYHCDARHGGTSAALPPCRPPHQSAAGYMFPPEQCCEIVFPIHLYGNCSRGTVLFVQPFPWPINSIALPPPPSRTVRVGGRYRVSRAYMSFVFWRSGYYDIHIYINLLPY